MLSEKNTIIEEIDHINFKLETYQTTFSDADEYATSYDDLQNELEDKKQRLDYIQTEIRKIEKK